MSFLVPFLDSRLVPPSLISSASFTIMSTQVCSDHLSLLLGILYITSSGSFQSFSSTSHHTLFSHPLHFLQDHPYSIFPPIHTMCTRFRPEDENISTAGVIVSLPLLTNEHRTSDIAEKAKLNKVEHTVSWCISMIQVEKSNKVESGPLEDKKNIKHPEDLTTFLESPTYLVNSCHP